MPKSIAEISNRNSNLLRASSSGQMRLEYKISVVKKNPSRENLNYRRRVKNSNQYGVIPSSLSGKSSNYSSHGNWCKIRKGLSLETLGPLGNVVRAVLRDPFRNGTRLYSQVMIGRGSNLVVIFQHKWYMYFIWCLNLWSLLRFNFRLTAATGT